MTSINSLFQRIGSDTRTISSYVVGPWPGIEPGLAEPQSAVLTPTPPQPWGVARHGRGISTNRRRIKKPVV